MQKYCSRQAFLGLFAICLSVAALPIQANAQVVEQVINDWQKKAARTDGVLYKLEGTVTFTKGHFSRAFSDLVPAAVPVPLEDYTDKIKTNWHIDLNKNWYRKEIWTPIFYTGKLIFYPRYEVTCFDGEDYVRFTPRKENTSAAHTPSAKQPDVMFIPNRQGAHNFFPADYPILFAHGIVPYGPISLENMRASVKPAILNYDRKEKKDGRLYHVLKTQARGNAFQIVEEIWVDPERESAIGHWKRWVKGRLSNSLSIEYVDRKGVWLPREWSSWMYDDVGGQVGLYHHIVVKEAVLNPVLKQADFRIKLRCDMVVSDNR
jgi:hypothetical protein